VQLNFTPLVSRGALDAAVFAVFVSVPTTMADAHPAQSDASRNSYIGAVTWMGVMVLDGSDAQ